MKMRLALAAACLTIVGSTAAQAATYDLASDFSNTDNPNGPWSYNYSGNPLAHQASPAPNGNPLIPAIPADGYFSPGNDLNVNTPDVFKAAVNGSSAGETDADFLAGDIVIHSPNDGTALSIVWTAPTAGVITNLALSVWYAHSAVVRSNQFDMLFAGTDVMSGSITPGLDRNNPVNYPFPTNFAMNAGDLLSLTFAKSIGQTSGSLNGVSLAFDFNASAVTPIPATLPLFVSALAGLGWCAHRRRKKAA